ncbi:DUF4253 domain-containing protein [Piscinibacter sp. HJYY11]|uniref:DUF4253 domain-containing protein n=1 Tax=Piscinibacter sp. HJYY11 TaxID=2801333 RepID=UPI00191E0D8C|nr:DUF4253 domain-containing protein [Piscinibacter sp. HJYY11]MBL0729602.1 DUF4253 domain-containing protein [Piscinibacter sp. HJYY11]
MFSSFRKERVLDLTEYPTGPCDPRRALQEFQASAAQPDPNMTSSLADTQQALAATSLESSTIAEGWISGALDSVLIVELNSDDVLSSWSVLRGLAEQLLRFPLVSQLEDIDGLFRDEPAHPDDLAYVTYPTKVLKDYLTIDGFAALQDGEVMRGEFSPLRSAELFNGLARVLGETQRTFGSAPDVEDVSALIAKGVLRSNADLELWLLNWEVEHFGDAALDVSHLGDSDLIDFDDESQYVAVLPPTPTAWEALLFMGWYGTQHDPATKIAALKSWNERFGAELVCGFASVLNLKVTRPPTSIQEAFALAIEHDHFASDKRTLSGLSLRDYARTLLASDRWQLMAKP